VTKTFVDGRVHVRKKKCATCIFGPNRLIGIDQERVDQMTRDADRAETCIPCHHHLYSDEDIEPVCRGYYDRASSASLRMATAMDIVEWYES
jgi:hypothetical protein